NVSSDVVARFRIDGDSREPKLVFLFDHLTHGLGFWESKQHDARGHDVLGPQGAEAKQIADDACLARFEYALRLSEIGQCCDLFATHTFDLFTTRDQTRDAFRHRDERPGDPD